MKVLILGGDGYLGWPTALYFSARGHEVTIVDSLLRRTEHLRLASDSLTPISSPSTRVRRWHEISGNEVRWHPADITVYEDLRVILNDCQPDVVIHYAELPSAPYSMIDVRHAVQTQRNNVEGTLNLIWAIQSIGLDTHLIKLGTMGEYGTPNIDIEEGYLDVVHNGRSDRLSFPKQPGSFYHLSKVHDSHNLEFATRVWNLRVTDLNQGVVHGAETDETALDPSLVNRFDYDSIFGTAINRFCVQAVTGHNISVYGAGTQTRTFINIIDTMQCVELAALHPPERGTFSVLNQFTEKFSVVELAKTVEDGARRAGYDTKVDHVPNPRAEAEEHYYNPSNAGLLELGLKPTRLSVELLNSTFRIIDKYRDRVIGAAIPPTTTWR